MAPARAVILSGDRGAGKTTLCLALAAMSPRYLGFVSPPLLDPEGRRAGFAARCLSTGEEWVLGRSDVELDGPRLGKFSFSSVGISRAVDCLRGFLASPGPRGEGAAQAGATGHGYRAGSVDGSSPASPGRERLQGIVIIVDEIGPLELERGEGLAPVLPLLADAGGLLLVARPSLVERVASLAPRHEQRILTVTPQSRGSLARAIDDWLA